MRTAHGVFQNMGIDPDKYVCVNMATTGVTTPIGILEIAVRFGEESELQQYYVSPESVIVPTDLNYPYTKIERGVYDRDLMEPEQVVSELVLYMKERSPSIVIINNGWWFDKLHKEPANRALSPLFARLKTRPVFPLTAYEVARKFMDYTIYDGEFEYANEMIRHINRLKRQSPSGSSVTVDEAYAERFGEEFPDIPGLTNAAKAVAQMSAIWENILSNNEAEEAYVKPV